MPTTMVHVPGAPTSKPKVKFKMPNILAAIRRRPIAAAAIGAGALGAASILPARKKAKKTLPRVEALIREYKSKRQTPEREASLSQLQGHKEMLENLLHRPKRTAVFKGLTLGLLGGAGVHAARSVLRLRQAALGGLGARAEARATARKPPPGGSGKVIDVKPVSVESKVAAAKMAGLGSELLRAYSQHPYLTGIGLGAAAGGIGTAVGSLLRPKAEDWAGALKEDIRAEALEQKVEPTYAGQLFLSKRRQELADVQAAQRFPKSELIRRYRKAIVGGAASGVQTVTTIKALQGLFLLGGLMGAHIGAEQAAKG